MKTSFAKKSDIKRKWHVIDADGQVVGRLATAIATILRGKDKAFYTPHVDSGDHVIVLNADKVRFTGRKLQKKEYIHHTGYQGGIKRKTAQHLLNTNPEKIIKTAVRGMLPNTVLGRQQLGKLRVYRGSKHPHGAQNPEIRDLEK